jgi:Tetrapyrrole (Corrin/Porphyrin) Methylases
VVRDRRPIGPNSKTEQTGSLDVVGTGIDVAAHLTPEARAAIEQADAVLYLAADPVAALKIESLNAGARSLDGFYAPRKSRRETYEEVVEAIVAEATAGRRVCAVFYGHPGVFAYPGHEAVRRARAAGVPARMLPALSSLDCLFADLALDPGVRGLQCYEATDFLQRRPPVDPDAALVLLQVGMLGELGGAQSPRVRGRFAELLAHLRELYEDSREAVLYEASAYPGSPPVIETLRLDAAAQDAPGVMATLLVRPPAA